MFDERMFDKEIDSLMEEGQDKRAEACMLKEYSALKAAGNVKDLNYVVFRLAHFYSAPDTENLERAEAYFLECETLTPGANSMRQTAWFYFCVLKNFPKTIAKVNEIKRQGADRDTYYSALTLKGQALIKLGMLSDAEKTLEELLGLIKTNPRGLPYGDEMNLLQASISNPILAPRCREILKLVIPNIRSLEYQEKGRALLKKVELGDG